MSFPNVRHVPDGSPPLARCTSKQTTEQNRRVHMYIRMHSGVYNVYMCICVCVYSEMHMYTWMYMYVCICVHECLHMRAPLYPTQHTHLAHSALSDAPREIRARHADPMHGSGSTILHGQTWLAVLFAFSAAILLTDVLHPVPLVLLCPSTLLCPSPCL